MSLFGGAAPNPGLPPLAGWLAGWLTDLLGCLCAGGDIVPILKARGLIDAVTNEELLQQAASESTLRVYCGFDPTADSLHLGNLLGKHWHRRAPRSTDIAPPMLLLLLLLPAGIVVLSWFSRCGHTPIALLGGAMARVGDPSGKSAEPPLLSDAAIEANIAGIRAVLRRLLGPDVEIVNNLDWLGSMGLLTFLRDVGKSARIGRVGEDLGAAVGPTTDAVSVSPSQAP